MKKLFCLLSQFFAYIPVVLVLRIARVQNYGKQNGKRR
jgi:hypothetical protein